MGRLRILVTRPEPSARRTAGELAGMGHEPIILPLTQTLPLQLGAAAPKDSVAVAITSANALRHAPPALIASLAALPCHAVGEKTAQAARAAGFTHVETGAGDAVALADKIAPSLAGKALVYLCGRVRFPAFEEKLAAAGVQVHALESYDTVPVAYTDSAMAGLLGGQPVDAVLLYSATAADAVLAMMSRPALSGHFGGTDYLCLSQRVGARLAALDQRHVKIARRPDEAALLALLPAGDASASSQRPFSPV
ncbi:uroporphyrinogen-III synthase [Manganibacter manganicus]|uniref:Uroporphyrinogen-III synthase n=1 Tax=Manganibacter manganicus TaxID=1873176 RepID=A0A1V8RVG3_9HYPH|nr:uroporphyrinogen-III synthase [Pseudaminobacter manganicus]OQM77133.1 uroporphyrinogen III synthase [Pseudaminobacter manganicus]